MSRFFRQFQLTETERNLLKMMMFANFHSSRFELSFSGQYEEISYDEATEMVNNLTNTLKLNCHDAILEETHNKLKGNLELYGYLRNGDNRLYRTSSAHQHRGNDERFSTICLKLFRLLEAEYTSRKNQFLLILATTSI